MMTPTLAEALKDMATLRNLTPMTTLEVWILNEIATLDEVDQAILGALEVSLSEGAIRLRKGRCPGTQIATFRVCLQEAVQLKKLNKIKVGLSVCHIHDVSRVARCIRCWGPGHLGLNCKGDNRSKLCMNCGEEGHKRLECRKKVKCLDCAGARHENTGLGAVSVQRAE
uniref:CCHC-type domain-containing protein n=1 Tax=Anopheles minimus TaxID=112268 RepID=A0A182VT24_9DIPT